MVRAETRTDYPTLDDVTFEEMSFLPMLAPLIRTPADGEPGPGRFVECERSLWDC